MKKSDILFKLYDEAYKKIDFDNATEELKENAERTKKAYEILDNLKDMGLLEFEEYTTIENAMALTEIGKFTYFLDSLKDLKLTIG